MKTIGGLGVLLAWVLASTDVGAASTDGIFAEFTTSMGSFTCRLDYAIAPKAVANFIGLATGQRAWLDLDTGTARTNAYYDGLTFHRVIDRFMIQGGSPNGKGTDGPGYAFIDEFNASARFTGTGVLAMANSGPNSNGAQYFITVAPATHLNDVHTIFGHVTSGTNVVIAISKVATNPSNNKPLTNVVVQTVNIRRVGPEAEAFDIHAQGLPVVTNILMAAVNSGNNVVLNFDNRAFADNQLYASTNLASWQAEPLGIEGSNPATNSLQRPKLLAQEFFKLAQVQYQSSTFAPKDVPGRQLVISLGSGGGIVDISFDLTGVGGSYTYNATNSGTIVNYSWSQEPYRGLLWPIEYSGLIPMTLTLNFSSITNGTFSGTAYPAGPQFSISGSFTLH